MDFISILSAPNPSAPQNGGRLAVLGIFTAALSLGSLVSPALAQRQSYQTLWNVAGRLDAGDKLSVKSGDVFLRHRLLPNAAARLDTDLTDEQGKVVIPTGAEMFSLSTSGAKIFCNAKQNGPSVARALLIGGGLKQVCAIDLEGDGTFDQYFSTMGLVKGLPSLSGRVPKAPKIAKAGGYHAIAPNDMTTQYFVGIEYEGKPLLYDRRNFRIVFGEGKRHESLSDWTFIKGGEYPKSHSLLGGSFTVLSETSGVLNLAIDREIPPQPFNVNVTISYR